MVLLVLPPPDHLWTNVCARARDAGRRARAAYHRRRSSNANGLRGQNSAGFPQICGLFKGIICDDISEFESHMPSHAVGSLWRIYPVHGLCEQRRSL
jgi:hypothetical protein